MRWMAMATVATVAMVGAMPAAAQQHEGHGEAAAAGAGAHMMMMCSVGGMGGGMQHGAAEGGMQHGQAQGGMQHGAAEGGMQAGQAQGGMQGGHGGMQGGHGGMTPWSHEFMALMHHGEEMGLSAEQTTKILGLRSQAQMDCESHMKQAMAAHEAANAAWQKDSPDVAAWEAALREATAHMSEAQLAVGRAARAALELLTPEQRTKAAAERNGHGSGGGH